MIRDLIEVRPRGGLLTDGDLKKLKRLYREHGHRSPAFYEKPSDRERRKRAEAAFRRKTACR